MDASTGAAVALMLIDEDNDDVGPGVVRVRVMEGLLRLMDEKDENVVKGDYLGTNKHIITKTKSKTKCNK